MQINSVVNSGSTGRITEDIGKIIMDNGHESYIAYGRGNRPSQSELIKIGHAKDIYLHGLKSVLFDRHGFGSEKASRQLIEDIKTINPDLIHLHNIHGYYLNIKILFNYLKKVQLPVVWTFHDCWPFTGHCSHFERVNCYRWESHCYDCPNKGGYPASFYIDNSRENFTLKKDLFTSLTNLTIITPSDWLLSYVRKSFFKAYPAHTINNGIDLEQFKPVSYAKALLRHQLQGKRILLGVANVWTKQKGLDDFIELSTKLGKDYKLILIGLKSKQIKKVPKNILALTKTHNIYELAMYYSMADVFINPTYSDNFPTTNIESLACGTPVITYNTGGSPEAFDGHTGIVVEKGDIDGLKKAVDRIVERGKDHFVPLCRKRAVQFFNKNDRYNDYFKLYKNLTG